MMIKRNILLHMIIALFFLPGLLFAQSPQTQSDMQADPYKILALHYDAIGGLEQLKKQKKSITTGTINFAGIQGEFYHLEEGIRFYREERYPAFSKSEGDDGRQMWSVDFNNKKLIYKDPQTLKRRKLNHLFERYEHAKKDSEYFNLRYSGTETVMGEACHIIEIKNNINDDIYYDFFSQDSFYLLKQVIKQPYLELSTYYSDFRTRDNKIYAFEQETNIAPIGRKISIKINTLELNAAIESAKFAIPEEDAKDYSFKGREHYVSIPFLLAENNIYLPVTIDGKTNYWLIDSGADMSVIDTQYAKQLKLPLYGKLSGNATSSLVSFNFAKLGRYNIEDINNGGGLELNNQIILSYEGLADNFFEPEAIGILGYDFLSRFITKIDYAKRIISFYEPQFFNYQGNGHSIDAPLQNRLFMVPIIFNERFKGRFGMDLGSYNLSMNYFFAQKHKLWKQHGVKRISSDIAGVFEELQIQSESIEIADFKIENEVYSIPLTKSKGTNSDSEMDGLVGNSLLRHFTLYLDYNKQHVIFEKGDDFNYQFAKDNSGMIVGLSEQNSPEVLFMAEQSPAQKAGIKTGDIILAVNGPENKELSPTITQINNYLKAKPGTRLRLKVLRKIDIIYIDLVLDDLFKI